MSDDALVIVTAGLVLVTMIYAYFTYKLVKETRKDRRIRWIGNKLSRLYYPLKNHFTEYFEKGKLRLLNNRLYLASTELRKAIDYIEELDIETALDEEAGKQTDTKERKRILTKIFLLLNREIRDLQEEIEELTRS